MKSLFAVLVSVLFCGTPLEAQVSETGKKQFATLCAGCHGSDGGGGEHAPSIVDTRQRGGGGRSQQSLRDTIQRGIPDAGMPAFPLTQPDLDALVEFVGILRAPAADHPTPGNAEAGERYFSGQGNCLHCHMLKGRGGPLGPELTNLARERSLGQIEQALRNPNALSTPGYRPVTVRMRDGRTFRGVAKNESNYDLQLQDADGAFHFLSKNQIAEEIQHRRSRLWSGGANSARSACHSRRRGPKPGWLW